MNQAENSNCVPADGCGRMTCGVLPTLDNDYWFAADADYVDADGDCVDGDAIAVVLLMDRSSCA